MRADISTTYNIRRVPGDQPHYLFYHIGTWGGRCPVKEGFMEEIVFEWFSKNRRSPRGRWRLFQAKGEVCAKVKWHDLGVSWGFLRENLEKVKMWGSVCRELCPGSWVRHRTASANEICCQHLLPPACSPWNTPNFSLVSPSSSVK